MTLFVGTDIGGTFTDLVSYDSERDVVCFGKTLTVSTNLVDGVTTCLDEAHIEPRSIDVLRHGTTQVINALLERRGARTALITTEGFRDLIEIGRVNRPLAFRLDYRREPPLVPRYLRFEVGERIAADGAVVTPLDTKQLERIASELEAQAVEAVAVSFLNAYRNPRHEAAAVEYLRRRFPGVFVCAGTETSREWFEFERTSTAVANAYVGSLADRYIGRLERTLGARGFEGRLFVMSSNGGVLSPLTARRLPIALVESGPIGGCIGAAAYADALEAKRLIAFDMGGTTAKCALIEDSRFEVQPMYYVGGYDHGFPIRTPVLDIVEVGMGGGSVVFVDSRGALHVGPRSAGAKPGPACFRLGGVEPTVTDAHLALDRISSAAFLGGALQLDRTASRRAIEDKVGLPLGYAAGASTDDVAGGVLRLANSRMASAIKTVTVERGRDLRDYVLFAFGGGGPLHAAGLARELHVSCVMVPPHPGNFSALGMLFADARVDEMRTVLLELDAQAVGVLRLHIEEMKSSLIRVLERDLKATRVAFDVSVDMRFKGQRHSITIAMHDADSAADLRSRFIAGYRRRYGFVDAEAAVEVVDMRIAGVALADKPTLSGLNFADSDARGGQAYRDVWFAEHRGRVRTPVYVRSALPIGFSVPGPAVVEEFSATTIVDPGDHLEVGSLGELCIHIG